MAATNDIELVCQEVVELVTEYLAGTLPDTEKARFDQHLSTCPPCTAYLAQMRTTLSLAAELGPASAPSDDEVAEQLGDLFRRWHDKRKT
jgi:anti-sigma factor RsiW